MSRTSLSLLVLAAAVASGCTQVVGSSPDDDPSSSHAQDLLTFPGLTLPLPDPSLGLVGRGFNRRAPLSRLAFDNSFGGGWFDAGASDRAQCVDFSGGIIKPSATAPMRVATRTLMVDNKFKFLEASTFSAAQAGDASVILPIEGVPVPVGATADHTVGSESRTDISAETINFSVIAKASLTETLRGSGNATIRSAVIDDVNAAPDKRKAFFAKCGDRYLDSLTLGGAIAIDFSLFTADATVFRKLKAKVNDSLHLGLGGATGSDGAGSDDAASVAIGDLLKILNVTSTNKVDVDSSFTFEGKSVTLRVNVRSLGPTIDTTNLTIEQALQLVGGWGARIQSKPAERAVLGAVEKAYTTTTNASQLAGALPGELDVAYSTLMGQVKSYYLTHYMVLNAFGDLERDLVITPSSSWTESWFDSIPSNTAISNARRTALQNTFANARAMECLVEVAPGSATSVYNACLVQPVVGDTSSGSLLGSKFCRLAKNIPSFGSSTINVAVVGNGLGAYPAIPRRRARLAITSTYAEFFSPLNARGITSPVTLREDSLSNACDTENIDGKIVFRSGPVDDGNWLTGSKCEWSAFAGLGISLKPGWTVRGTYNAVTSGANPGSYRDAPGTFGTEGAVEGTVKAEKWLSTYAGVQLQSVSAVGPIDVSPENLYLVPGLWDITQGLR